jgi:hypothetical protein
VVLVEDLAGCKSGHEVALIRPAGVAVDESGVDLGVESAEAVGDHGKSRFAIIESRVAGSWFLGV